MKEKEYMTAKEAAKYLGISLRTLKNFMRHERFPIPYYKLSYNLVRFHKRDLDRWMKNFKQDYGEELQQKKLEMIEKAATDILHKIL